MKTLWHGAILLALAATEGGRVGALPQGTVKVVLFIDGGNAYVFSENNKRVDVGPVTVPKTAAAGRFNPHQMFLIVQKGIVEEVSGLPFQPAVCDLKVAACPKKWALAGYEIWLCPDGDCAANLPSSLSTSPDDGANVADLCNPSQKPNVNNVGLAVDNMFYLPDLLELHGARGITADWHQRMDGRLVLRSGRLTVVATYPCFSLTGQAKKRALVDGLSGMEHDMRVDGHVDLVFKDWRTRTITGVVRVKPAAVNQAIQLHLTMDVPPPKDPPSGGEIAHFQQFYELLPNIAAGSRIKLTFTPLREQEASPGSECPGARFGGP